MTATTTKIFRELRKTIGSNIEEHRMRQNMSLLRLARESGVSARNLGQYERGKRDMRLHALVSIAAALGTRAEDLLASVPPLREHP